MTGYDNWIVNGVTPSWIITAEKDPINRILTLHCAAIYSKLNADPRSEIKTFQDMACHVINNEQLLNGGSKLQVRGGNTVSIIEKDTPIGDITYKAAIEEAVVKEDSMSDDMIEYDIIAHYETSGADSSKVYVPSFHDYSNIELHEWYYLNGETWVKEDCTPTQGGYGSEIGWMQIVETRQIKKVEIYGSGCRLPASVTIDGSVEGTQNWNYQHDVNPDTNVPPNDPFQKLTYNFAEGSFPMILTIYAATGQCPTHIHHNHGAWIKWVKVTFV